MKIAITILLVILAVLACGCTSTAPSATTTTAAVTTPAAAPVIPSLIGTWTGSMQGYEERIGYTDYGKMTITIVVTEQHDRLFSGHLSFGINNTETIPLAGVISRDGKTFAMVENANGYTTGEFTGTDTMELTHIDDADPYSAALDTLRRV